MTPRGSGRIADVLADASPVSARLERCLPAIVADPLHAFLAVDEAGARAAAAAIDAAGPPPIGAAGPPLRGVTVAVKDNLCALGVPTTCGSRILEGFHAPYEATAVRRLRAAGAIVVGKTNLDEFAMGSSTENSAYGPTRNPHDPARVPGGSSGGSAAAVAAGLVDAALGSDTGGSVRQPAAFCGVVGFKPTYGRVSRYGLVAFASSLDQVGTFGRRVEDAARVLQAIAGPDRFDATACGLPVPDLVAAARLGATTAGARALVVGVPREYVTDDVAPGVRAQLDAAIERLRAAGAAVRDVSLPHTELALPAYCVIAPAEASSNLARYDGVRFGPGTRNAASLLDLYRGARSRGFGREVKRRIVLGTFVLSAGHHERYFGSAQRARLRIARDFDEAFGIGVHVLLTPTSPDVAFRFGERVEDPYAMYRSDRFTVAANLAGLPAISVPIGTSGGLPVGAQLIAPRWSEASLVRAASALEHAWEAA